MELRRLDVALSWWPWLGSLPNSDRLLWSNGRWPGGPIDANGPARTGSNSMLLRTAAVGEPDATSLHLVQPWSRAGNLQRVIQAGLLTEAEQQTNQCPADDG